MHSARSPARQSSDVLQRALSESDVTLRTHASGVGELAAATAVRLGVPDEDIEVAHHAGQLHDVGKLMVPDAILNNPGPLSEPEWAVVRRHPIIGQRIIAAAPALADVARLVRWTHERFEGGGYPDGLGGSNIPLITRIVTVCDAYDAMVTGRTYRPAIERPLAIAELRQCAGTQFDPEVVDAFAAALGAFSAPEHGVTPAGAQSHPAGQRRDEAGEHRDNDGDRRDAAGEHRDEAAGQRDEAGERRDDAAEQRDVAARRRDEAADRRDRAAKRFESGHRAPVTSDSRKRSGKARQEAAEDRRESSRDRLAGAGERDKAVLDRTTALADRGAGASERTQAELDRSTALADRGASARERRNSSIDNLTGAYVRGAGFVELDREIARVRRSKKPLVVAFIDVDGLKAVNDSRGHHAGDLLLREVAEAFRANLRAHDLIVRYGGDEFVCAVSGLSQADAQARLGLINATLADRPEHGSVTFGLAELRPDESAEDLVARADAALYRGRGRGRRG